MFRAAHTPKVLQAQGGEGCFIVSDWTVTIAPSPAVAAAPGSP